MGKPLRVLVVEDSEDDLLLLLRALKQGGYAPNYVRVDTPEAMRNALQEPDWELVISDYSMPHFSALEALGELRATGRDLPFIIISGTITDEMAVAGMRAGAHDYLMKDNMARLGPAVERELADAQVRRKRRQDEESLRQHQQEIEALNARLWEAMFETQHRVRNSLQIIFAVVDLYRNSGKRVFSLEELGRIQACIDVLTIVHNQLMEQAREDGEATHLSGRAVLTKLVGSIQARNPARRIVSGIAGYEFPTREATSLALVADELLTNALKYSVGDVSVSFAVAESQGTLTVRDRGPGFPPDFDPDSETHTGLELVQTLVRHDLAAVARYEAAPEGGAVVSVVMPLPPPKSVLAKSLVAAIKEANPH